MYRNYWQRGIISALFLSVAMGMGLSAPTHQAAPGSSSPKTSATQNLGPAQAALRTIITSGRLEELRWPNFSDYRVHLDNFYRPMGYVNAWLSDGKPTPQAVEVIQVLRNADREGLRADDYDASRWAARLARLKTPHEPAAEARFDAALTVCLMRYISDVRIGKINPRHFKFGLDVSHHKLDLPHFLRQDLVRGTDLKAAFALIDPPNPGYERLRQALLKYTELAKAGDGDKLPVPVSAVLAGSRYDHVTALAKRLRLLGDLPDTAIVAADSQIYDGALAAAVKTFQRRHGLQQNGQLDADTVEELNVPLAERVEQMRLTLERYRWVRYQFSFSQPTVIINIPEFRLYAVGEDRKTAFTMNVNVGDAYDFQTPVFENAIRYLVFRPYWSPPPRILRNEIIPDLAEDPDLANADLELVTPGGQLIKTSHVSKAQLQQLRTGKLSVRQPPGPNNALGLVKFIFPNEHHVYLHDTPQSYDMFSKEQRAFSHGCIHVQDPAKLAAWLLRNTRGWDLERVDEAMEEGRDNFTVNLPKPVPIMILYGTALVEPDGEIRFHRDIYGHDAELEQALAKGYPYPG